MGWAPRGGPPGRLAHGRDVEGPQRPPLVPRRRRHLRESLRLRRRWRHPGLGCRPGGHLPLLHCYSPG
eukprot:1834365-Alexandrium_andersonii.AAC.1